MKTKRHSEALAAIHETALDLRQAGLMSKQAKQKFDELVLPATHLQPTEDDGPNNRRDDCL